MVLVVVMVVATMMGLVVKGMSSCGCGDGSCAFRPRPRARAYHHPYRCGSPFPYLWSLTYLRPSPSPTSSPSRQPKHHTIPNKPTPSFQTTSSMCDIPCRTRRVYHVKPYHTIPRQTIPCHTMPYQVCSTESLPTCRAAETGLSASSRPFGGRGRWPGGSGCTLCSCSSLCAEPPCSRREKEERKGKIFIHIIGTDGAALCAWLTPVCRCSAAAAAATAAAAAASLDFVEAATLAVDCVSNAVAREWHE